MLFEWNGRKFKSTGTKQHKILNCTKILIIIYWKWKLLHLDICTDGWIFSPRNTVRLKIMAKKWTCFFKTFNIWNYIYYAKSSKYVYQIYLRFLVQKCVGIYLYLYGCNTYNSPYHYSHISKTQYIPYTRVM